MSQRRGFLRCLRPNPGSRQTCARLHSRLGLRHWQHLGRVVERGEEQIYERHPVSDHTFERCAFFFCFFTHLFPHFFQQKYKRSPSFSCCETPLTDTTFGRASNPSGTSTTSLGCAQILRASFPRASWQRRPPPKQSFAVWKLHALERNLARFQPPFKPSVLSRV